MRERCQTKTTSSTQGGRANWFRGAGAETIHFKSLFASARLCMIFHGDARDGSNQSQALASAAQAGRVPDEGPLRPRDLCRQGARSAQTRVAIFSSLAP